MHSHHLEEQIDRLGKHHSYYAQSTWLDRLQQPSVLIPVLLILLTVFYQSLHSSPLSRPRHPGELLWDLIVTITPASVLYTLNEWLYPLATPTFSSMRSARSSSYVAKSELLRRIIGMDGPSNIISSVADAGRRGLSSLSNVSAPLLKRDTDQPPGLGNYDNSCFQNSILQGLSSLKPLPTYLTRGLEQDEFESDEALGSASSLRNLIAKLTDSSHNGETLWTPKKLKSLDTWQQQDAQEYFSKILDEVEKEIIKAAKPPHCSSGFDTAGVRDDTESSQHSDDSGYQSLPVTLKSVSDARALRNPLEGLAAQRVACVQCGHSDGLAMIPFNCLTLNLGLEQTEHNLFERLDSYTDLETIEGVECAKCTLLKLQRLLRLLISRSKNLGTTDSTTQNHKSRLEAVELALEEDDFQEKTLKEKCGAEKRIASTKTKQVVIARPPQSLAIHMNRSVFDENTGHMFKNLAVVRYPRSLDLGPWCLGSAGGPATSVGDASISTSEDEEQWVIDPKASMVSGDREPSRISGPIYELRAVITHQGRHENGHYVCYRKHPRKPSKLNDSPIKEVESLGGDDDSILTDGTINDPDLDKDAKWWRLSDESVWEVSEETVLAQGGGVFMLFYDCVDPNPNLASMIQSETGEHSAGAKPVIQQEVSNGSVLNDVNRKEIRPESEKSRNDSTSSALPGSMTQAGLLAGDLNNQAGGKTEVELNNIRPHERRQSCLIPLLADGEQIDSTIPLHRPNS
ncbi:cysteine proteinase [Hypoxylon rubiginosum]|uniref:Cysteine proteinase n=1 Tax=Hypoxylon rubiginosum TaxID=110542 RepID=A0ACC0DE44_9PEZI|nr:cysteine proteinase [Hypoxylon rubiginosum]